jgi:hypothetical protein
MNGEEIVHHGGRPPGGSIRPISVGLTQTLRRFLSERRHREPFVVFAAHTDARHSEILHLHRPNGPQFVVTRSDAESIGSRNHRNLDLEGRANSFAVAAPSVAAKSVRKQ